MKKAAPFAGALLGFELSVLASLALVARAGAGGKGPGGLGRLAGLAGLALLGFAIGLVPAVLLRGTIRFPFLTGLGVGLFWLGLAVAGEPYTLGLKAPAGIGLVSVFLGVFVSGGSIGASLLKAEAD